MFFIFLVINISFSYHGIPHIAERQGFEPWEQLPVHRISSAARSTTPAPFLSFAERAGFEPAIRFRRIHAFQACLFNHSSISPSLVFLKTTANYEFFSTRLRFLCANLYFLIEIRIISEQEILLLSKIIELYWNINKRKRF